MSSTSMFSNNNLIQIFFALLPDRQSGQNLGKKEKLAEIQDLLKYGVEVNAEIRPYYTPLCRVIEEGGSKALVELLLYNGARVDISPPEHTWKDPEGGVIANQVFALARQRSLRCRDKESLDIQHLVQKRLIQKPYCSEPPSITTQSQAPKQATKAVEVVDSTSNVTVSPKVFETVNSTPNSKQSLSSSQKTTSGHTSYSSYANTGSDLQSYFQSVFQASSKTTSVSSTSSAASNTVKNYADQYSTSRLTKQFANESNTNRRIFVFGFENVMVNGNFHRILEDMGVAPSRASVDLVEFLLQKYGIKNQEFLQQVLQEIIKAGDFICIASLSSYPETIVATLKCLGLTKSEINSIFYTKAEVGERFQSKSFHQAQTQAQTKEGSNTLAMAKKMSILEAMVYFNVINVNNIYVIESDPIYLEFASSKLNIPEVNLIQLDSEQTGVLGGLASDAVASQAMAVEQIEAPMPVYLQQVFKIVRPGLEPNLKQSSNSGNNNNPNNPLSSRTLKDYPSVENSSADSASDENSKGNNEKLLPFQTFVNKGNNQSDKLLNQKFRNPEIQELQRVLAQKLQSNKMNITNDKNLSTNSSSGSVLDSEEVQIQGESTLMQDYQDYKTKPLGLDPSTPKPVPTSYIPYINFDSLHYKVFAGGSGK